MGGKSLFKTNMHDGLVDVGSRAGRPLAPVDLVQLRVEVRLERGRARVVTGGEMSGRATGLALLVVRAPPRRIIGSQQAKTRSRRPHPRH